MESLLPLVPLTLLVGLISLPQPLQSVINWLLGIGDDIADFLAEAISSAFDALRSWLWHPLRDWLVGGWELLNHLADWLDDIPGALWDFINGVYRLVNNAIAYVFDVLGDLPNQLDFLFTEITRLAGMIDDIAGFVAGLVRDIVLDVFVDALVSLFLFWVEPIADLLENYIVEHWED